jgi:hypothetical protein
MISLNISGTIKDKTVTDMPEMQPNKSQIEALQNAVTEIYSHIETLKSGIQTHIERNDILSILRDVVTYKTSFDGTDGWFWRLNTWNLANEKLCQCLKKLKAIRESDDTQAIRSLVDECDNCISSLQNYRTLCEGMPVKDETSMTERFKALVGLKSQLEALKNLAS